MHTKTSFCLALYLYLSLFLSSLLLYLKQNSQSFDWIRIGNIPSLIFLEWLCVLLPIFVCLFMLQPKPHSKPLNKIEWLNFVTYWYGNRLSSYFIDIYLRTSGFSLSIIFLHNFVNCSNFNSNFNSFRTFALKFIFNI